MARIVGSESNDILTGTSSRDRIAGLAGDDELRGGEGGDRLDGGAGRDLIFGEGGNDTIVGATGVISTTGEDDDIIDGGEGIDWVTYASLEQGVQIFLGDDVGFAIVPDPHPGDLLPLQSDELIGIENAIGSRVGISSLGGNSADNVLIGLGPRTNFVSSAGDDTYQVQGKGHPAFFFLNDPGGIVFDLPAQRVEDGFGGIDCLRVEGSVEVLGSAFDDTLIGSPHRDWLDGYLGDDEIHGGGGSDILNGGRLGPNDGVDLIDGGRGSDWLKFWFVGVPPPVVVDLSAGTVTAAGETDTLQSIENVVAPEGPTEGSHVLIGDAGSNRFVSIGGDTIMTGGAGADRFQQAFGGLGDPDVITDFEKGRDLISSKRTRWRFSAKGRRST